MRTWLQRKGFLLVCPPVHRLWLHIWKGAYRHLRPYTEILPIVAWQWLEDMAYNFSHQIPRSLRSGLRSRIHRLLITRSCSGAQWRGFQPRKCGGRDSRRGAWRLLMELTWPENFQLFCATHVTLECTRVRLRTSWGWRRKPRGSCNSVRVHSCILDLLYWIDGDREPCEIPQFVRISRATHSLSLDQQSNNPETNSSHPWHFIWTEHTNDHRHRVEYNDLGESLHLLDLHSVRVTTWVHNNKVSGDVPTPPLGLRLGLGLA